MGAGEETKGVVGIAVGWGGRGGGAAPALLLASRVTSFSSSSFSVFLAKQ